MGGELLAGLARGTELGNASAPEIVCAPEVAAAAPASMLAHLYASREYADIVCAVCRREVSPNSAEQLSVLLLRDRGLRVVEAAHADCAPSKIVDTTLPRADELALRFDYRTFSRKDSPTALLIFEHTAALGTGREGEVQPYLEALRAGGFDSADALDQQDEVAAAPAWWFEHDGRDLLLIGPPVDDPRLPSVEHIRFADVVAPHLNGRFAQAIETERRCILVYGTQLGLQRLDWRRIRRQSAFGEVVAAGLEVRSPHRAAPIETD